MNLTDTLPVANTAEHSSEFRQQVAQACEAACQTIAPAWPLDQAIAVNPHWHRIHLTVREVAARMAVLGGIQVFPTRESQRHAWEQKRIREADLYTAIRDIPAAKHRALTLDFCISALEQAPKIAQLPLLIDVLDDAEDRHSRLSWREAITHQVSQTCAAYFDHHQAQWQPERSAGLYAFWRETITHDPGIGTLMGLPQLGRALHLLPANHADAEVWVMQHLGLPREAWVDYLEAVLLTVNGWASSCAYLSWQAKLAGGSDQHLRELLAIRLAWGIVLLECAADSNGQQSKKTNQAFAALRREWEHHQARLRQAEDALLVDEVWQRALELGYQNKLASQLRHAVFSDNPATAEIDDEAEAGQATQLQAVFCIDVRSEPMRRALEAADARIQTKGFAGFFGVPAAYSPLASASQRPQLPGLLASAMQIADCVVPSADSVKFASEIEDQRSELLTADLRQGRQQVFARQSQWSNTSRRPSTAFNYVEAAGVSYLRQLWRAFKPQQVERNHPDRHGLTRAQQATCRPRLLGLSLEQQTDLAAKVLHAMGLERDFAPVIVLVGHGSQSTNNAHAAALDCGACCGQTGEVNVRSLVAILNAQSVRSALREKGIVIPQYVQFMAALHNTTTDEIETFDLDLLGVSAQAHWKKFASAFAQAGDQVRRERAHQLGENPRRSHQGLLQALRLRANDAAQTRPEYGLANNAAFLMAPSARGLNLQGRSFMHDYRVQDDPDLSVLELLMTAPMLVTHWINWQYHSSTCEPQRFGSGNKVLHNVVGGKLGVFEGNGGDLRIGLSKQSLHDGERWIHEPLRLTVVIAAPNQVISSIINKHAVLQNLLHKGWLHLWSLQAEDGETHLYRYTEHAWLPLAKDLVHESQQEPAV